MDDKTDTSPPFLVGLQFRDEELKRPDSFPFNLPWLENFELRFTSPVTFLVGENGSGKSTLIEAIANLSRFPVGGGSRQELANPFGPGKESELAQELSPVFVKRPRDGYFFRAEFYAEFATLLDEPQATEFLFATSIPDLPIAS